MTRADVVVVRGGAAIVVPGDRAHDVLTACGVVIAPTLGWQAPLDGLPRLRAHAEARGWLLVEHGRST